MSTPLMPKATAVWLVDNTALTFDQIAEFCGLHPLEVQAIADGEVAPGMQGIDPTSNGQLEADEIKRCEGDPSARLQMASYTLPQPRVRAKGPRYTPISKRGDKPDGIAFLLKTYPQLSDAQIGRLIGTTKATIEKVRDRTHWNASNIKPQNPVELGLCTLPELNEAVSKAGRRISPEEYEAEKLRAEQSEAPEPAAVAEPTEAAELK